MAKDFYEILGVSKTASQDEIRKAYYKLAHQHHPHKGGDEAKMKEINEAWGVLGNEDKRKQYDQFGQTFNQAGGQGAGFNGFSGFGGQGGQSANFDFSDLGDLFGDLFGGQGGRARSSQNSGSDISAEMTINFSDAVFGLEKTITLAKDAVCDKCHGSKAEPGSKNITCKTCHGSGQIVRNVGFGFGFPSVCPDCQGNGSKPEKICSACRGKGVVQKDENITIKIPAGIDHGQSIRLPGKGNAAPKNGQPGDLYIKIKVAPDLRFKRQGYDIYSKNEISFTTAALGGKIEVETIDGQVWLKIPEGTQSGKVFRLKNHGVTVLHSRGRGDHLVELIVKTPIKLSRRQKDLLRELENEK